MVYPDVLYLLGNFMSCNNREAFAAAVPLFVYIGEIFNQYNKIAMYILWLEVSTRVNIQRLLCTVIPQLPAAKRVLQVEHSADESLCHEPLSFWVKLGFSLAEQMEGDLCCVR